MMPWTLLLCLLLSRTTVSSGELQCFMWPAGTLHPVQAQLERFEAVTGCAAREGGAKETHVISVGKTLNKQVTVVLSPLNLSRPVNRPVILVLSSQHAVRWVVDNEGLSHNINLLVQVSQNSTAASASVSMRVAQVPFLPGRPGVLLRWVLQRHTSISSLIHTAHANHVHLRLGEDPSMPSECHLQSLFLSQNYLASELQEQEVHGCVSSDADAEVHIIRLWSSGSTLCGSLQVDVSVSLQPPEAHSGHHRVILVLSSAVPVNWGLVALEVKGHIRVYSSSSVSLLYSHSPDLTMTSTVTSDLSSTPDLLEWANQNHIFKVTSYTEADLANHFLIKLRGGERGADVSGSESWMQWFFQEDEAAQRYREAISCRCDDRNLTVTVDTHMLQVMSLSVMSVSLRDHSCKAEFNGTHFLLDFSLISCGTEGETDEVNARVRYKNTVFLWKPSEGSNYEMNPVSVQISCETLLSTPAGRVHASQSPSPEGALRYSLWSSQTTQLPSMELFMSKAFERRAAGPCVITAYDRLYVQMSVVSGSGDAVELQSCWVSPLSDPQAHSDWYIITHSCPSDPSLTLIERQTPHRRETADDTDKERHDSENEQTTQKNDRNERRLLSRWRDTGRVRRFEDAMIKHEERRRWRRKTRKNGEENTNALRFSFILRPVFNNSIQFLHCSLQLCVSGEQTHNKPSDHRDCAHGPRIPALTHTPASQQCEDRYLSRPVLVTSPVEFLAPPAGKCFQKPAKMSGQTSSQKDADMSAVLVVVFVAFVMGLSLMGALWCIYTYTGRRRETSHRDGCQETTELSTTLRNMTSSLEVK